MLLGRSRPGVQQKWLIPFRRCCAECVKGEASGGFIPRMTNPLSFSQLRVFAVVAEYKSFTRAAEELRVTQPYVSGQIASLEARLSLPLFNRVGRRVYLNEAGLLLLPHV